MDIKRYKLISWMRPKKICSQNILTPPKIWPPGAIWSYKSNKRNDPNKYPSNLYLIKEICSLHFIVHFINLLSIELNETTLR